jgi:hypothetical protein
MTIQGVRFFVARSHHLFVKKWGWGKKRNTLFINFSLVTMWTHCLVNAVIVIGFLGLIPRRSCHLKSSVNAKLFALTDDSPP